MKNFVNKYFWKPIVNSARPDFCEHILDTALLYKWPIKKISEPLVLEFPIPEGCDTQAEAVFALHQRTGLNAQYLACIPNGVAAGGGFVRLPNGQFLTESAFRMEYLFGPLGADFYHARYRRHKLYLEGDCYNLTMLFTANYGHWFYDELPRLASALPHLPAGTKFIVNDPLQDFKLQSLAALGVSKDRLIPVKGYVETHCERLWFATPLGNGEWTGTSPAALHRIRQALLGRYAGASSPTRDKIFVSRSATNYKRLGNEDQLLPIIEGLGFEVIRPEQLSFPEQVQIFSRAKVILGTFGAGLTNILFSPQPALVVELQDTKFAPRRWYWKLASLLGHRYCTITGPISSSPHNGMADFTDTEFTIHPDSLKQFLKSRLPQVDGKSDIR
jgi:capsular polysaccharide biosynthesis protein